jgi:hypothetical protein
VERSNHELFKDTILEISVRTIKNFIRDIMSGPRVEPGPSGICDNRTIHYVVPYRACGRIEGERYVYKVLVGKTVEMRRL